MITLLIKKLDSILSGNDSFKRLLGQYNAGIKVIKVEGPEGFFTGYLVSRLADLTGRGFLVIVPSVKEALSLVSDLTTVNKEAVYFPGWDTIPYSGNEYQLKNSGERMRVLSNLLTGKDQITVTTLKALVTPLPPPDFIKKKLLKIARGNPIDIEEISRELSSMRYMRVPRVTVPGEYSLKGEVLDIYMPGDSTAVRIVFEWDDVEAIRRFDPVTQISLSV
ncbi:MAG: transcription-repair coupling factor, partial [Spirochaetes bacterium]